MQIENERKFKLNRPASEIIAEAKAAGQLFETIEIQQFYCTEGGRTSRYRCQNDSTYYNRCTITKKRPVKGSDRERFEYEEETDFQFFERMQLISDTPTVRKTRFEIKTDTHWLQLDVFQDELEGLEFVEIEAELQPNIDDIDCDDDVTDDPFNQKYFPDWIGEEVTGDPEYRNEAIAMRLGEIRRSRPNPWDRKPLATSH